VTPEDRDFLLRLHASARGDTLAVTGWSAEQQLAFSSMQLDAQTRDYAGRLGRHAHELILLDGRAAGRIWLVSRPEAIDLLDIALLPAFRARGIGTAIVSGVLAEADRAGAVVTIHVALGNPASRLYERLGFVALEGDQVYQRMQWPGRV
jgi:GNAT superfamily N-acetyltransferase